MYSPFSSGSLPGTWVPTRLLFLPSYTVDYMCIFLIALVVQKSPSASFQLVFSENCSTCRYIFDVILGGNLSSYSAILMNLLHVFL